MAKAAKRRLTVSLDETDYMDLERLAGQNERSLSWIICHAVKRYLEEVEQASSNHLPRERQIRLFP